MFRFLALGAGIVALSVFPVWADNPPPSSPGELAQDVVRLTKSGVDDGVIVAFVDTQRFPVAATADDFLALKTAGVSPTVLAEVARHDALFSTTRRPVTEAEVYRLFGGVLYHEGHTYGVGAGLPDAVKRDLISDPLARDDINDSENLKGTALGLTWGGLGLAAGGAIFAGVSQAQNSPSWGSGVGLGAIGLGVVTMIVGSVVDAVSYQDLYHGLYQYNRDLISQSTGGKS